MKTFFQPALLAVASLVPRPFSYAHAREGKEGSGK